MLQLKRILFPTDFPSSAGQAFKHALFLARKHRASIHVLYVFVDSGSTAHQSMSDVHVERKRWEAWELNELLAEQETAEVQVELMFRVGEAAAPVILSAARENEIELIVMGSHGRGGHKRDRAGSVVREVVRLAPCPIFVARFPKAGEAGQEIKRILVPIDFSEHARPALRYAKELAEVYDARIDLLHVFQEVAWPSVYGIEPMAIDVPEVLTRIRQALHELAKETLGDNTSADVHEMMGHPAQNIVQFAWDRGSDLIVIPTHGRTGFKRLLLGSVAEKVIETAPCPVFVVHSFGRSLISSGAGANALEAGLPAGRDAKR